MIPYSEIIQATKYLIDINRNILKNNINYLLNVKLTKENSIKSKVSKLNGLLFPDNNIKLIFSLKEFNIKYFKQYSVKESNIFFYFFKQDMPNPQNKFFKVYIDIKENQRVIKDEVIHMLIVYYNIYC